MSRKKSDENNEKYELNQKDFVTLYIYGRLQKGADYATSMYQALVEQFKDKGHSKNVFMTTAKMLGDQGYLSHFTISRKKYYEMTDKGREHYAWYQKQYKDRFEEVKKVIDRFVFDLTRSGVQYAATEPLPNEYRHFFSRLVSVKDLVRYVALREFRIYREITMNHVNEVLESKFGWTSSNGYLYELAHEMEEEGLIISWWDDEIKRRQRIYKLTDRGNEFYKRVEADSTERVVAVERYLRSTLQLFKQPG